MFCLVFLGMPLLIINLLTTIVDYNSIITTLVKIVICML